MTILLYILASSFTWFSSLLLTFSLFRFSIKDKIPQSILTSFVLSLISYVLNEDLNLDNYIILFQIFFYFLFMWLMFGIQFYYALIVSSIGYVLLLLLALISIYFYKVIGLIPTVDKIYSLHTYNVHLMRLTAAILLLTIRNGVDRYRLGFTFVPEEHSRRDIILTKMNQVILLMIIITLKLLSIWSVEIRDINDILPLIIILIPLFVFILYLVYRNEIARRYK